MAALSSLEADPIRLYVTTGLEEPSDYSRVFEYLESARGFFYLNTGTSPLDGSVGGQALRESLRAAMARAEIVVALAELDDKERDLLAFQIAFAQSASKPVLLLPHFGSSRAPSRNLLSLVTETAEWDQRSLVDAIRKLARGEDTQRWETVEFKLD
jgi:hypothetical protein